MSRHVLVLCLPFLLPGCYLAKQAEGQLTMLFGARDIDAVLDDPSTPSAVRRKLHLIREIKAYGEREMGLVRSTNYTRYYDTGGNPATHIVMGCRKDRFEPSTWWYPIVGDVPYKGFFRRGDARREAEELEAEGYDVVMAPVDAYSTLGWFSDPVLSPMVAYSEERLAALILHELTHVTIYLPGGTDFNEGLAQFVGEQGALEFVRWRFGADSPTYDRAVKVFAASELRDVAAQDVFKRLDDLYRSETPAARKIELRDLIAGRTVNNAEILNERRYGRRDEFRAAFERAGGDWARFFAAMAERRAP